MKNFVILILVVLVFIGIAKMTQTPNTPNRTSGKSEYSAASSAKEKELTPTVPPSASASSPPQTSENSSSVNTDDSRIKAQLDSLSMQVLAHAESHDNSGMQVYFQKMAELGVTEMCQTRILQKQTPSCPPVKISVNGTVKSGSLCAITCYTYKGREYDVGYCK